MKFLFFIFCAGFSFGKTLILSPGEKVWIPFPNDQKVRLGDKNLLILQKEDSRVSLLAKKTGHTLLTADKAQYQIFIFEKSNKEKALRLDKLLKKLWGLNWSLTKDNIFEITGQLYRFSDWLEIMKTCKRHNIPYQFKAQLDEELKKISSYYFKTALKQNIEMDWPHLPYVHTPANSRLSDYTALKFFGLIPKEEKSWLFKAPLVQIDLAVAETLSSSVFSAGGNLLEPLSHFSSLLSFLNFLKSSGKGSALHHSTLLTQSGKELKLNSGGQIPFNSYNLKTEQKSTNWKSHGLQIHLIPTVGKKDQIKLKVKAQLSEPLPFTSVNQAPPLKTQSLESEFVLSNNQILKLLQLNKKTTGNQYKGQFGFLFATPSFLSGGHNHSEMTQSVFIQTKILNQKSKQQNLKEIL